VKNKLNKIIIMGILLIVVLSIIPSIIIPNHHYKLITDCTSLGCDYYVWHSTNYDYNLAGESSNYVDGKQVFFFDGKIANILIDKRWKSLYDDADISAQLFKDDILIKEEKLNTSIIWTEV
jgi:hypothetical protein